uniref:KRAB-related domain-containing protein n=1 Tax=Cercocebus atys TaxID=9531 RepID=A0A2K5MR44_CERAT
MNGDNTFARRPRDDAQISEKIQKKEWEKMKAPEKIFFVYMKINYEVMTNFFNRNKRAADFHGFFFDNDRNRGNQEMSLILFICFFYIIKIMPKKPAEIFFDSKQVAEASGPRNGGKQLWPPRKPSTSEKINKRSGPKKGKHAWTHFFCERKQPVISEEIFFSEEDDE